MLTLFISVFWNSLAGHVTVALPVEEKEEVAEVVKDEYEVTKQYIGEITAYSSREEETDDTPFTAANGEGVHWGMVATNAYPFGTELRFPDLYGEKIFTVKDRMHSRYKNRIDIWFPSYMDARTFGRKTTTVEVVRKTINSQLSMK